MRMIGWVLAGLLAAPAAGGAQAAPAAVSQAIVDKVQMPAWLQRDGRIGPLAAGTEVRNGDTIRTGTEARVYLQLAEGSTVKLGESATLNFYSRSLSPASNFKGAIDVVKGAFRFTTGVLQGMRGQREIVIRVGTATAGIRGTDIWGKSDGQRDLILLIDGKIEVRHAGVAFEMVEPLTYFSAPRNAPAQPLRTVDPESFRAWARETEILPGDGASQRGGEWNVVLAHSETQGEALAAYDRARHAGYATQIRVRAAGGRQRERWRYEVIVSQLGSAREAAVLAARVKSQLGFEAAPDR